MLTESVERQYLSRIQNALDAASASVSAFLPGSFAVHDRGGRDVVTEADRKLSDVLRESLLQPGEGWLSEEDADDSARLSKEVVWIVDPLDGTREFVDGIPEWCISIGLTVSGTAVAGGIFNPATGELFLGGINSGVTRIMAVKFRRRARQVWRRQLFSPAARNTNGDNGRDLKVETFPSV
jgi:myo-inositol-1(or 4)-monophosphatase